MAATLCSQCVSHMGNIFNTIQVALCIHDVLASEQEELWIQPKKRIKSQTTAYLGVQLSGPKFFPWEVEEVGTSAEDHSSSPNHPKRQLKTEKKNSEESSSSPHDPDLSKDRRGIGLPIPPGLFL